MKFTLHNKSVCMPDKSYKDIPFIRKQIAEQQKTFSDVIKGGTVQFADAKIILLELKELNFQLTMALRKSSSLNEMAEEINENSPFPIRG